MISMKTGCLGEGMTFVLTPRNAGPWRAIAEFLDAQHLASFGLTRVPARASEARRQGPACGMGLPREAHPVGNTGITSKQLAFDQAVNSPLLSGVPHG